MKAIISITNKSSQYSKLNGQTFEIKDFMKESVGLLGVDENYPNNQTDFSFNEIIVVDIKKELELANKGWRPSENLLHYIKVRNISL